MKTYQYTIKNMKSSRTGTVEALSVVEARLQIKNLFPNAKQILITPLILAEV